MATDPETAIRHGRWAPRLWTHHATQQDLRRKELARKDLGTKGEEREKSSVRIGLKRLLPTFKNKEELALVAAEVATRDLKNRFHENFPSKSTFQIWRDWIESSVSYLSNLGFGEYKKQALKSSISLMNDNYLLAINASYENILTEYLSKDFQMNVKTERLPRLVACMLWSGNEAAMKRCAGLDTSNNMLNDNKKIISESIGVVDEVEQIFSSYIKYPRG